MNNGWIKLHRGLLDWEWYDDANTCRLFLHCLLRANHADKCWRGIEIKRGSFFTSLDTLAKETGLTASQLRTSLKKLNSTSEVTSKGQATGRMITVSNYDAYQSDDKQHSKPVTSQSQASDKPMTTNKNDKNKKNEKNSPFPSGLTPELLDSISDHWNRIMTTWAPSVKLTDQTQINKKRWAKIKKIVADNPNYVDHEYWLGHFGQLATLTELEWQRNNKQLTFDQAVQLEKFERNLGYMKMGAGQ